MKISELSLNLISNLVLDNLEVKKYIVENKIPSIIEIITSIVHTEDILFLFSSLLF